MQIFLATSVGLGLRKFFVALWLGVVMFTLQSCDATSFKSAADLETATLQALDARNYSEAAGLAKQWSDKANADYEPQFLLAQANAQIGDKNGAIGALERAIKLGLKDDEQIDLCANLTPIQSMTAYQDLMAANFPSRARTKTSQDLTTSGDVHIQIGVGKETIRAGDVILEVPTSK